MRQYMYQPSAHKDVVGELLDGDGCHLVVLEE